MSMRFILIPFLIFMLIACSSNSQKGSQVETGTKDTNKIVKESSQNAPIEKNEMGKLINEEDLIGFWFQPRFAEDNIKFLRNGTFVFYRYNSVLDVREKLEGTYKIENNTVNLFYTDRSKEVFHADFEDRDSSWRIENKENNFVKGVDGYDVIQNKEE